MTYERRPSVMALIHAQPTSVNVLARLFHDEENINRLLSVQHEQLKVFAPNGIGLIDAHEPIKALNSACDLQEYYYDAARTFLDNPLLRLLPIDLIVRNLGRVARLPLGDRLVSALLRAPLARG